MLYGIAAALLYMKEQKAGHFINVSSVAGHEVIPAGAVYAATKYAVRALSVGLRQEVKPYNIRTTVISPGAVATELSNSITEPDVADNIHNFYEALSRSVILDLKFQKIVKCFARCSTARCCIHADTPILRHADTTPVLVAAPPRCFLL